MRGTRVLVFDRRFKIDGKVTVKIDEIESEIHPSEFNAVRRGAVRKAFKEEGLPCPHPDDIHAVLIVGGGP